MPSDNSGTTRRRVLQSLGATSTASLAGCGGGQQQTPTEAGEEGGGEQTETEQQELGERVPKVTLSFWSNTPTTPIIEQRMRIAAENLNNRLGIETEPEPKEQLTQLQKVLNDKRTSALPHIRLNLKPWRIEPTDSLNNLIDTLGVGAGLSNWASQNTCKYEQLYRKQVAATDQKKRQEIVTKMLKLANEDVAVIPLTNSLNRSTWNTNKIEPQSLGRLGPSEINAKFFIDSSPKQGDTIIGEATAAALGTIQPTRHDGGIPIWAQLVHSGLRIFDENLELKNLLAKSVEIERDGKRIITELIDDVVFHNGEPITAEDVKFSFKYVAENPKGVRELSPWPHESIEVIDEKTTQFNLKRPSNILPRINFALIGIMHKQSMVEAGALENPAKYNFDDVSNLIGSGPFVPVHAVPGSTMRLEPFQDHPVFDVDHKLQFDVFDNKQTAIQAFKNGELHTLFRLQYQIFKQLKGRDDAKGKTTQGWTLDGLWPQFPFAPTKFNAFRKAVSQALDRKKMSQLTAGGAATEQLHGTPVASTHPWHEEEKIPDVSPSPSGDAEVAKQTLRDAGWGWDDNGNLHYPADADLSPLWPKGEKPNVDKYPCLKGGEAYA